MLVITRNAVIGERTKTFATWLFVLPLFTEGVLKDVVKFQWAALAVLILARIFAADRPLPPRAIERIYLTCMVLALVVLGYLAFGTWPRYAGPVGSYDQHAAMFVITYTVVAVFAVLFFRDDLFERVLWQAARIALWFGVLTCAVSRTTGLLIRVNANDGALRMVGTLTEPSDWAPVLALVMLLALRRKSWLYATLSIAGLVLTDSPTCILVMAITVPLYFALANRGHYRAVILGALVILVSLGGIFVQRSHPQAWMDSRNSVKIAVGRLVSGLQNIETGGQSGVNGRFQNATIVVDAAKANGWMHFGAGPGADATYFPVMYPATGNTPVSANAIWVSTLFDLGELGTAVLLILVAATVWRIRPFARMTALLLPFIAASMVNSSIPDYSFTVLGIMLFGFGWTRHMEIRHLADKALRLATADVAP